MPSKSAPNAVYSKQSQKDRLLDSEKTWTHISISCSSTLILNPLSLIKSPASLSLLSAQCASQRVRCKGKDPRGQKQSRSLWTLQPSHQMPPHQAQGLELMRFTPERRSTSHVKITKTRHLYMHADHSLCVSCKSLLPTCTHQLWHPYAVTKTLLWKAPDSTCKK